jgi:hypothetical protein
MTAASGSNNIWRRPARIEKYMIHPIPKHYHLN